MLKSYLVKESSLNTLTYCIDEPLAPHSTFGIGGQCDYFVKPHTTHALISLIRVLKEENIRYTVIGNGSNILFDDNGFRGCVISTKAINDLVIDEETLTVSCGYSLIALSSFAQRNGLSGLEFACSIPATLGGAIYMNAGAYGGEMKDIVHSVLYLSSDGEVIETTEHDFSYRHSIYHEKELLVLSAKLKLSKGDPDTVLAKMQENKEKRAASQPIKDKSAGSVFKRTADCIPAKLIDEAGLKGLSCGDAEVSRKHAGFIINRGHATASDVLSLIEKIKTNIYERYQVHLVCEIRYIPAN